MRQHRIDLANVMGGLVRSLTQEERAKAGDF